MKTESKTLTKIWVTAGKIVAMLTVFGVAPAGAGIITENLLFNTSGQNQWSSGPADNFSTGGSRFVGVPGFSEGFHLGGGECLLLACAGAEIGFSVGGKAGINYDVKIDSGSLSISFPQRVSFSLPDPGAVKVGKRVNITSALIPATTVSFTPFMQTVGPTAQALVEMQLQANLQAVARVCTGFCFGPDLNVGVNESQELLAFNFNNDGEFRVLGEIQGAASGTLNKGALNLSVQQPILNTDSRVVGGFDGTLLSSNTRSNVLTLSASLDKIVSDLLGLPPLNAESGGFGYNIVTAHAGLAIDITQNFSFDPDLMATFFFTAPVLKSNSPDTFEINPTSRIDFRVGETISFRAPGAASLGIAPSFVLDNVAHNETGLKVYSDFFVSAGGISAFGLEAGPIFQHHIPTNLADIPLFGDDFRVNIPPIQTNPFNLIFDTERALTDVEADPCLDFTTANDPLRCREDGLLAPISQVADDFNIYKIANLFGLVDTSGDDCILLDGLGRPCAGDGAPGLVEDLLSLEDTILTGEISRFVLGEDGLIYLSGLSIPDFVTDEPLPVSNDTEDGAQRLAGLGFVADFAPFVIPEGAPFPNSVPEPATLVIFGTGLAGIVLTRRRKSNR